MGRSFNVTQAGIHADGLLKERKYTIYSTRKKLLNRPVGVAFNQTSVTAGISHCINSFFKLTGDKRIDKRDEKVIRIKEWVDEQYKNGRVTSISDRELERVVRKLAPELYDMV